MSLFAEEFLELHKNIKLPIILLNTSSVTPVFYFHCNETYMQYEYARKEGVL